MTECNHLHERTDQYNKTFPITDGVSLDEVKSEIAKQLLNYVTQTELSNEFSQLESQYIKVNDTTIVRLVNLNEINLQEDHYNAWFGYRDGNVTNWKFGDGTEGGYANIYAKNFYLNDESLLDSLDAKANNSDVYTKTDLETKTENFEFTLEDGSTVVKKIVCMQ